VGESVRLAAAGPPPVLLLVPEYPEGGALPAGAASGFWKQLNAQREALGLLDARVLLCLDSVQEPYAAAYARDLLSWCAPKFAMLERHVGVGDSGGMTSSVVKERDWSEGSSDAASLLSRSLGPLWEELVESGRLPTVTDIERMGIPLLENALHEGRLKEAEAVDRVISAVRIPRSDVRGNWLRLRGDLARSLGRFPDAEAAFDEAMQLHEVLLREEPKSLRAKRDLSVTIGEYAAFLEQRGQRGDAELQLALLERNQRLMQQILDASPDSADAKRDVSVSLNKLGDFLAGRAKPGDEEQALRHYERSLEISEQLIAANPESGQAARDVSVSLSRLGDFLSRRGKPGDVEAALGHYERSLEVRERLLAANPESGQAARDVSLSLERLGDYLMMSGQPGDAERVLGYYEQSLELSEQLLAANPESGEAARDVSVGLSKLGDFLAGRDEPGDAEQALGYYERSLEVAERLWASNRESGQAKRDVSVSLSRLGDFLSRRGKPGDVEAALGHYERSLETRERLLEENPESGQAARDVMVSLERMAAIKGRLGGGEVEALEWQRRALGIALELWERNAPSCYYGRTAAVSSVLAFERAFAAGRDELAENCLSGCHRILDELIRAGCELDPEMLALHARLKTIFGGGAQAAE
jgi:tetratricopeptide (TPR) repeat protein